ncbi:MAG: hypothetical protein ACI4T5_04140, partial [Prevotella sp.]
MDKSTSPLTQRAQELTANSPRAANVSLPLSLSPFQLLKKPKMCNFDAIFMHNNSINVHFSSFFAQKICKCEIKV